MHEGRSLLKGTLRILVKAVKDVVSTMYDDFDYKYMSAPRVWGWIACICIVIAWIADQFFGLKFSGWAQLITWAVACLGAYAAKKFADRGNIKPPDNQQQP